MLSSIEPEEEEEIRRKVQYWFGERKREKKEYRGVGKEEEKNSF